MPELKLASGERRTGQDVMIIPAVVLIGVLGIGWHGRRVDRDRDVDDGHDG
jgi:hypothetical protein